MEQIGLLCMSLEASLLILAIVVLRSLALHRLPKSTFIALWGVAAARLLIPIKIPSSLSIYSLLGHLTGRAVTVTVIDARIVTPQGGAATAQAASAFSPSSTAMLWVIGFALCAAFFVSCYVRCTRRFACSLPVESDFVSRWLGEHKTLRRVAVRRSDEVSSPLTYGVLKPVILLPNETEPGDSARLTYILAHEHAHIRRFDAAAKLLLALVVSIHWFNPAVWVMYILANRDLELRCDECAVRSLGEDAKSLYALALIGMAEKKSGLTPLCSGFCKTAAEERIVSIMKIRKTSAWSVALALALVTSTCAVFATSAKSPVKIAATPLVEADSISGALVRADEKTGKQEMSIDGGKTWVKLNASDPDSVAASSDTVWWNLVKADSISSTLVRTDEKTGKQEMSIDGGKTWDKLNASDPDSVAASSDVVWWTADEYAKWLEQEKKGLQELVGTGSGYYGNGVYHEWTQEHVDETIAMYEGILKDIKSGIKHSKTVDGRDDIAIAMKPDDNVAVAQSTDSIPATEITLKATKIEAQDSVPFTKLTEGTKSIPATKITEKAKKSK